MAIINIFTFAVLEIDFGRQNLTSADVRFWRVKSIPALYYGQIVFQQAFNKG